MDYVGTKESGTDVATQGDLSGGGPVTLPRCRATRTANQSVGNASDTPITLPTEDVDSDGFHSTSVNTSRLTIPTGMGGTYMVSGNITWESNATGLRFCFPLLNGGGYNAEGVAHAAANGTATRQSFSTLMELAAGDYIEVAGRQTSGANRNVTKASLQLVKVG